MLQGSLVASDPALWHVPLIPSGDFSIGGEAFIEVVFKFCGNL